MMTEMLLDALLYAAYGLTVWLYLERSLGRARPLSVVLCAFAVCYAALFGVHLLGVPALDLAAFTAANAALIFFCRRPKAMAAALHTAVLSAAAFLSEAAASGFFALLGPTVPEGDMLARTAIGAIGRLLFFLLTAAASDIFRERGERASSRLFLVSSAVCILISSAAAYACFAKEENRFGETMTVLFIVALLFANILLLIQHERMRRANEEYTALQLSMQKETSDLSFYRTMQENYNSQRILVHDIRNHFLAIEGLAEASKADEVVQYIAGLEHGFLPSTPAQLSKDPILNTILVRCSTACGAKGVSLRLDLDEGGRSFLDAPSTTMLYGNLLSNALEASEVSREKWIELSVRRDDEKRNFTVILVNSCDEPPEPDGADGYRTRKNDPRMHGVGLKSIERVVQSYNGIETSYYDAPSRSFHHIIQFPI